MDADVDMVNIRKIQESGHTRHCACRQVWGDGECECGNSGTDKLDRLITDIKTRRLI